MLQKPPPQIVDPARQVGWDQDRPISEIIDLERLGAMLRRRWLFAASCLVAALALAAAYLFFEAPRYSSVASIMIDRNNARIIEQVSSSGAPSTTVEDAA